MHAHNITTDATTVSQPNGYAHSDSDSHTHNHDLTHAGRDTHTHAV